MPKGTWRTVALLPLLTIATVASASSGCRDQAPPGRVEPASIETKVGQTVPLELFMRPAHENMQREIWKVEPASLGEVYYDQATAKHRSAMFRAKQSGTGKITVQGFSKDAKPQPITQVPVTVTD